MNTPALHKLIKRIKARHERSMTINKSKRLDPYVLNDLTIEDPEIKAALKKMDLLQ